VNCFDINLVRRNNRMFRNYSRLRSQYAYDVNPEKTSVAFKIIPVLLSVNEPDLPGYVAGGQTECGVYGVGTSDHLKMVIQTYFPEKRKGRHSYQKYLVKRPMIESLFIMGSIGTIAQKDNSDYDFWVCVDKALFPKDSINKLRQKTERIARWCEKSFEMEVHFFIMDLKQIRRDNFGRVGEESTGSSQRKFLKEEFYRTMLLVSGKVPFWWVLPPGIDQQDYEEHWNWLVKNYAYDFDDFLDLGFLGDIPREEFLGMTLWQLSKGIEDPFKALIKMSMMERYMSDTFQGPLLCDVLKERVLGGSRSLRNIDPYLLMVETALDFYDQQGKRDHMALLRKAFYIKAELGITRMRLIKSDGQYKANFFRDLMKKWEWPLDLVEELNQIQNWSYAHHLKFAEEINKFFFSTYRRLSKSLPVKQKQVIDEQDLTLLGRKLFVLFSKQKNKLVITPFLTKKKLILDRCIFQFARDRSSKMKWVLYDATRYPFEGPRKESKIFSSHRVVRAATWLVINGLYDFYLTKVEMPSNRSGLNVNDLIELLKHLQGAFRPAVHKIKMGTNLLEDAKCDRIMIVADMEETSASKGLATIDLVFSNIWGEVFTEKYPFQEGLSVAKEYVTALDVSNYHELPSKLKVHVPKSSQETNLKKSIYQVIF